MAIVKSDRSLLSTSDFIGNVIRPSNQRVPKLSHVVIHISRLIFRRIYQIFGAFKHKFESKKWEVFNTSHTVIQYRVPQPSIFL